MATVRNEALCDLDSGALKNTVDTHEYIYSSSYGGFRRFLIAMCRVKSLSGLLEKEGGGEILGNWPDKVLPLADRLIGRTMRPTGEEYRRGAH